MILASLMYWYDDPKWETFEVVLRSSVIIMEKVC